MELEQKVEQGIVVLNNYDNLKKEIENYANNVKSMVFTQDNEADTKKYRAEINKKIKALDEARKSVKKEYLTPLNEFESKIKALQGDLNGAIAHIDNSLSTWEVERQAAKLKELKEHYKDNEYFSLAICPKWLNKTTTYEDIDKDLELYALREKAKIETTLHLRGSETALKNLVEFLQDNDIEYEIV